jgi:hypothetical protein
MVSVVNGNYKVLDAVLQASIYLKVWCYACTNEGGIAQEVYNLLWRLHKQDPYIFVFY